MRARLRFVTGLCCGGLLVGGGLAVLPSLRAGEPVEVRLLVGCSQGTRPQVLEALRRLPVKVVDLDTMEAVALEAATPRMLRDAQVVHAAVIAALEQARKAAGEASTIHLSRLSVEGSRVSLEVLLPEVVWFDHVFDALRGQMDLARGAVQRGPVTQRGTSMLAGSFEITGALGWLGSEYQQGPEVGAGTLPGEAIQAAFASSHATLHSVSPERRMGNVVSTTYLVDLASETDLPALLQALQAIPGLHVTELSWQSPSLNQKQRTKLTLTGRVGK